MSRVKSRQTIGDDEPGAQPEGLRDGAPGARWMPSWVREGRVPIRLKLVAVLFLPMTLLGSLAALRVVEVRHEAQDAQADARMAQVIAGPGSLLDLVIGERNFTAVYLLGAEELFSAVEPGQYLEARQDVDTAREEFEDFIARQDEEAQEVYAPALDALSGLREMRSAVDADEGPQDFQNVDAMQEMFERVDDIVNPLFDANQQVSLLVTDPALLRATAVVDQSLRQSNSLAVLTYQLATAALAGDAEGIDTPEQYVGITRRLRDMELGEQIIRLNAEGDLQAVVSDVYGGESMQTFFQLVNDALATGTPDVSAIFGAAQGDDESLTFADLREAAEEHLQESVDQMNRDAQQTRTVFAIFGLLALVVMAVVTALVARSITRPLRALTRLAISMATDRLPQAVQAILEAPPDKDVDLSDVEPIEIRTRDEVIDVARALSTVQDSALKLALEQAVIRRNIADSFVNLGRRNQLLLGRQLDFITELERNETDSEALADLYRLDHLATRMRRNAESLLVLAGIDPPRKWTAPVRITDVIRASLGEVEDYQRVVVQGMQPAAVVGAVTADLAHLLAELIENALTFSPPGRAVEVRGRFMSAEPSLVEPNDLPPSQGTYTITISDYGVGMSEEDIAQANQRLAGHETFMLASRFLGHYVSGKIAALHGIDVKLHNSSGRGLTATLRLPPSLLTSEEAQAVEVLAASAVLGGPLRASTLTTRALAVGSGAATQLSSSGDAGQGAQTPGGAHTTIETYQVGKTKFHVDRGSLTTLGPATQAPSDYAQLIRRAQGTQLPATDLVRMPRTGSQPAVGDETEAHAGSQEQPSGADRQRQQAPGGGDEGNEARAVHVQNFLSTFSAGVKQGREMVTPDGDKRNADEQSDDQLGAASEGDSAADSSD
jgi:signal transduction histidine kinase